MNLLKALMVLVAAQNLGLLRTQANSLPFTFHWADRRVIGADFLGGSASSSTTNPRGWFNSPNKDYVSTNGMGQFRMDLLARADAEIRILTNMNAQGVIFWDIEGEEIQSITYVGDPRHLALLAPEMDACADEFFAKYRAVGLKVGLTIRPNICYFGTSFPLAPTNGQVFIKTDAPFGQKPYACITNGVWMQQAVNQQKVPDFYTNILSKIEYAKARWGATLFYLDSYGVRTDFGSNYFNYKDIALTNLMFANPGRLLMPELTSMYAEQTNYFAMSAPYQQANVVGYDVPPAVRSIYPAACAVVRVTSDFSDFLSISNGIAAGNIMLVNTWYTNVAAARVQQAYPDAAKWRTGVIAPPTGIRVEH